MNIEQPAPTAAAATPTPPPTTTAQTTTKTLRQVQYQQRASLSLFMALGHVLLFTICTTFASALNWPFRRRHLCEAISHWTIPPGASLAGA